MKNKYLLLIIPVIIIVIIVIMCLSKKGGKITNIKSIKFFYSTGNGINESVSYELKCNNNCTITVKKEGVSDEDATKIDVDKNVLDCVEKVLNKYNVSSWNGFDKNNRYVLDGNSFSLSIDYDNKSINAHGYMMWPKNYKEVKKELDRIFMDAYNNHNNNKDVDYKPIIYLYPTDITDVTVKLGYPDKLIVTYPKYDKEWDVVAYPNGKLIDKKTNRELYSLFWEGYNTESNNIKEEGFIVKGDSVQEFLEEKLSILGLNEKEQEEFIIYWLPKLMNNKYNYIRFETMEEQNRNMPLIIDPKPDTVIRVNMEYKALDDKIEIKEQKLNSPKREGFTVVEWGGTILELV